MPNPPAGWYTDPEGSDALRWWSGEAWSTSFAPPPAPFAPSRPPVPGRVPRIAIGTTAGLMGVIGLASSGVGGMLIMVGLVGMTVAVVGALKGTVKSFRIRSRRAAIGALAGSFAIVILGGAVAPHPAPSVIDAAQIDSPSSAEPAAEASSTPSVQPLMATLEDTTTSTIPFAATTVDDPALASGTTTVTVAGINGVRTTTWRVTYSDGDEVKRVKVSEEVTTPPVDQVTAVGSYVAPPPPVPAAPAAPSCDPNYSGQCVPIASDVDCAGGSGNGPAYTSGPVTVVGYDKYDLDRDGDGIACD